MSEKEVGKDDGKAEDGNALFDDANQLAGVLSENPGLVEPIKECVIQCQPSNIRPYDRRDLALRLNFHLKNESASVFLVRMLEMASSESITELERLDVPNDVVELVRQLLTLVGASFSNAYDKLQRPKDWRTCDASVEHTKDAKPRLVSLHIERWDGQIFELSGSLASVLRLHNSILDQVLAEVGQIEDGHIELVRKLNATTSDWLVKRTETGDSD